MNQPIEIPNKSSFKINEVCALTGVKSYVLRFWESEFSEISPLMSSTGIKLYEHRDIEAILLIKKLLFDDKLTIEKTKSEMKILMPYQQIVNQNLNEFEEEDASSYFEESKVSSKAIIDRPYSQTTRVIIDSDINKLVMAKTKLNEILSLAETLKQKYNWI